MYPFERFTEAAKGVLTLAQEEAEGSHRSYIGTEHLVIGLIRQDCLRGRALLNLGQSVDGLRTTMQEVIGKSKARNAQQIIPTSQVKTVIELAFDEARRQASSHVGTDHILLAILLEGEGLGASMLALRGVTLDKVRAEIDRLQAAGGVTDQVGQTGWVRRRHEQFNVADAEGRSIELDVAFPSEYSDEQSQAVVDRIKNAFRDR